jgi:O-6-methylguanine DNA methyltransferase
MKRRQRQKPLTGFQLRVLEETLKIPLGEVRTYSWIARKIGMPGAVRAVGSALRKNPYPLLIPCHRVIKSSGGAGEYSRGRGAKRKLLELEKRLKNIFCLNHK